MSISTIRNYWSKLGGENSLFAALNITNDTVILVILKIKGDTREVKHTFFEYFQDESSRLLAIENILSKIPIACRLSIILPESMYQWLLIDKPAVEEQDISASLPWLLKDLVGLDGEDIVADYYESSLKRVGQEQLHVAVTSRQSLLPIINLINKKKLDLYSISTYEMACCELIAHDNHAHMVVTQQPNLNPNLHIIRNGQLLFTRRLSGLEGIAHLPLVALEDKQLDTFIQELQYSLDYYQNHLKQPPAVSLQLAIPNPEIDYLVQELSYSFAIEVSVFSSFLAICEQKSNEVQFAIAAALSIGVGEQNEISH